MTAQFTTNEVQAMIHIIRLQQNEAKRRMDAVMAKNPQAMGSVGHVMVEIELAYQACVELGIAELVKHTAMLEKDIAGLLN